MVIKSTKKFIAFLLSFSLLFITCSSVFAETNFSKKTLNGYSNNIMEKQKRLIYNETKQTMTKYVERNDDGTFKLNIPEKVKDNLDSVSYEKIYNGMLFINQFIKQGILKSTASLRVYDPNNKNFSTQDGENNVYYFWNGIELCMDNYLTNKVVNILYMQAGAYALQTTILAFISMAAAICAAICGTLCTYAASIISYFNEGNGVWIDFNKAYIVQDIGPQRDLG